MWNLTARPSELCLTALTQSSAVHRATPSTGQKTNTPHPHPTTTAKRDAKEGALKVAHAKYGARKSRYPPCVVGADSRSRPIPAQTACGSVGSATVKSFSMVSIGQVAPELAFQRLTDVAAVGFRGVPDSSDCLMRFGEGVLLAS